MCEAAAVDGVLDAMERAGLQFTRSPSSSPAAGNLTPSSPTAGSASAAARRASPKHVSRPASAKPPARPPRSPQPPPATVPTTVTATTGPPRMRPPPAVRGADEPRSASMNMTRKEGAAQSMSAAQNDFITAPAAARPSPKRAGSAGRRRRPGSAPSSMHASARPASGDQVRDYESSSLSQGGQYLSTLGTNGLWPTGTYTRTARFATQYARDTRLQQIHLIYGQFLGQPHRPAPRADRADAGRPVATHCGAILVGDFFPMPTSPSKHVGEDGVTYRIAPPYPAPRVMQQQAVLDEGNKVAEQQLPKPPRELHW